MSRVDSSGGQTLASIVISTFNRADALMETLEALGRQDLDPDSYEVIVVDDGSSDHTRAALQSAVTPYRLRTLSHDRNRGVSAGRNSGIKIAAGRYLIFVSDDVLVPPTFIRQHVETLEQLPGYWIVGAFRQRDSLRATPFGRYLDDLERGFERGRIAEEIAPGLSEMTWPTARNLSLPRADLAGVGLFDERFRTCCEDQDLAERARAIGIRFAYNAHIDCIHNDQAADLARYCSFQERGARDTVLLCAKSKELHGDAAVVRANGYIALGDGVGLAGKKLMKLTLSRPVASRALERTIAFAERMRSPERLLRRGYAVAISLAMFRGWRRGLREGLGEPQAATPTEFPGTATVVPGTATVEVPHR